GITGEEETTAEVLTPESVAKIFSSIEQHESVFSEKEIVKAVTPFTENAEQFARALIQVKSSEHLLYLGAGDDGRDRFTTRKMFNLENEIQDVADVLRQRSTKKISSQEMRVLLEHYQ